MEEAGKGGKAGKGERKKKVLPLLVLQQMQN